MARSVIRLSDAYCRPRDGGRESRRKGSFRSFIKDRLNKKVRLRLKADLMDRMTEDEADLWDPYEHVEMEYDPDGYWDSLYGYDDSWDEPYDLDPLCDPNEWEDDRWDDHYDIDYRTTALDLARNWQAQASLCRLTSFERMALAWTFRTLREVLDGKVSMS